MCIFERIKKEGDRFIEILVGCGVFCLINERVRNRLKIDFQEFLFPFKRAVLLCEEIDYGAGVLYPFLLRHREKVSGKKEQYRSR